MTQKKFNFVLNYKKKKNTRMHEKQQLDDYNASKFLILIPNDCKIDC